MWRSPIAWSGRGAAGESVIILSELLDNTHFDDERYVILHEERLVSELRETAFRRFAREINEEMSAWLEHHDDPDDHHLEQVIRKYEEKALPILQDQYREFEMPFDRRAVSRPRRETRRERRYLLPAPFDFWDARNPWQRYFFIAGAEDRAGDYLSAGAGASMTFARSGSGGSSQRGQHTICGLAFALRDVVRPIPTHILVYDRHNRIMAVDSLDHLCLVAADLGSNYSLSHARVSELTQRALRCTWVH